MGNEKKKAYWSMTEGVFNCLIDKKRTLAFKKAIYNTIKKGDVVVDMGTGSGILAMFAADAGAKKVYAVEIDENNIRTLKENFKINGFADKIAIIKGDICKVKLPEKVDVIIGEMIATGLIEELQVPAMNNILKFSKKGARVLLKKYEIFADLVYNSNSFYGRRFNIFRYEYSDVKCTKSKVFTKKEKYLDVDFSKINKKINVNKKIRLKIIKRGVINGIRISGRSTFFDNSILHDSYSYSFPILLPIDNIKISKDDCFVLYISYKLCNGLKNLNYKLVKTNEERIF